jgi:hypothetical protein
MLMEILKRTPPWVFVLFFLLLAFGYYQTKPRVLPIRRVAILPTVMIGVSIFSVVSAFGISIAAVSGWITGVVCALILNRWLGWPWDVSYSKTRRLFALRGSWFPLALMMAIFLVRYAVGVLFARRLSVTNSQMFASAVSLVYGLLSGVFLAGAVRTWRLSRPGNKEAA